MPDPRHHARDRNWIEQILRNVPGFAGYLEKDYRRESDELQRAWLADRLLESKKAIDALSRRLVDAGQIDLLPTIDRVRVRLDTLATRIQSAVRGYSGFFDLVQVDETLLDQVYQFDLALLTDVELLAKKVENLPNHSEGLPGPLSDVLGQIDAVEKRFAGRDELLAGLAE